MDDIILYTGIGIFIIGGIGLLIAAFRTSILWGATVLLIPPAAIFYLVSHWQNAKKSFKTQILGLLLILISIYLNGGIDMPTLLKSNLSSPDHKRVSKCVTTDGKTYYGEIPSGITCKSSTTLKIVAPSTNPSQPSGTENFKCDGRQYCSQMTSCAEAMHFNTNCPNTKMSGDGDGIPCEKQWCGY